MSRRLLLPIACILCVTAMACGNYSADELILTEVPSPEDVELHTPGVEDDAEAQALTSGGSLAQAMGVCADWELRCDAREIAQNLNGVTRTLLSLPDFFIKLPPTKREKGRRIWGPWFDENEGRTTRIELARVENSDGVATGELSFCIHSAPGDLSLSLFEQDELDCSVEQDGEDGLAKLIYGTFDPGDAAGEQAQSGAGSLVLDGARIEEVFGQSDLPGVWTIDYNNFGDPRTIGIGVELPDGGGSLDYTFTELSSGAGTFGFAITKDFHVPESGSLLLESLEIDAHWNDEKAGRARGRVSGGDLEEAGVEWVVQECWDPNFSTTYFRDDDENHPDVGEETACVLPEPDL